MLKLKVVLKMTFLQVSFKLIVLIRYPYDIRHRADAIALSEAEKIAPALGRSDKRRQYGRDFFGFGDICPTCGRPLDEPKA